MSLSKDLASAFAKITNDSNEQTEETVYGTVVSQGGKLYVNLDGSDSITPVVTTAEIKSGERVAVLIKNHTATVIGNITNPGASTETTGKILDDYDVIVAKIGDFELIVADKIDTKQLEAELAIIEELIADKATILELEAVKATIKDLDVSTLWAELAEIEKAVITKAEIKDLDAVHATIDILEADLAEIETLVGGQLTMDNIQSLVLTSSKVTVDNAFIKDAMIDRVNASKIDAGTINTNKVNIGSDDGSMSIIGSLQQFKDNDDNVRIQIGKDATGDFTFVLYGEDGKGQLINQNGITATAIGDGLIVNDMVADNAHISGDKLDISSVITAINGDVTTIDSSRIYFDDTNQTLSVAFNQLKDTVELIKEVSIEGDFTAALQRIETLTTELNIAKGDISTLISNTTIETSNGETITLKDDYTITKQTVGTISNKVGSLETTTKDITSKQSSLEQSLDSFEVSVSKNYATKTEVTTVDNKFNNYYDKTSTDDKFKSYYNKTEMDSKITVLNDNISTKVTKTDVTNAIKDVQVGGRNLLKKSDVDISNADYMMGQYFFGDEKPIEGETYTITLKGILGDDRTKFGVFNSGGYVSIGALSKISEGMYQLTAKWKNTSETHPPANTHLNIYQYPNGAESTSTIEWIKMERGNKVSLDWYAAPEDIDGGMIDLQNNLEQNMDKAITDSIKESTKSIADLYARKDTFENFQHSISSEFGQMVDNIQIKFDESILASNNVNGKLEEYKAIISNYIRFDINGMEMGKTGSPFISKLTNEKLAFLQNGYEVAYISNNRLYITEAEILDEMIIGQWSWNRNSNGNLRLRWRG